MERLEETIQLAPFKTEEKLPKSLEDLPKQSKDLVIDIEGFYSEIAERINWLLNRVASNAVELVKPGSLIGENGNAKILVNSDGDVEIQIKVSGAWQSTGWKLKGG